MRDGVLPAPFLLLLLAFPLLPSAAGGAGLSIESRVGNGEWGERAAVEALTRQVVSLRVPAREGGSVRWFRIIPDTTRPYNNAVWPWDPGAYRWLGYARIRYEREEVAAWRGRWEVSLDSAKPDWCGEDSPPGSYWFQAEVRSRTGTERSPGLQENDRRGLSPRVLRVTFREGDDLLGHLTGYHHVPGVFGSTPYQVRNFIAVDCADVLMAARCRSRGVPVERDYNVLMVIGEFKKVAETVVAKGNPATPLRWGREVRKGDLIAVKYPGWGQYGHIGALCGDSNGNGVLDEEDMVLHAGPLPLHRSALSQGAFDGEVKVVRPPS